MECCCICKGSKNCTYQPNKCSITVEHNIVFNEDDILIIDNIAIIPSDTLAEGRGTRSFNILKIMPSAIGQQIELKFVKKPANNISNDLYF
jgi:hypothetical protein